MTDPSENTQVVETDATSRLIDARLIDWPKVESSIRTFSKQKAEGLAHSIRWDGLIHPITVRPNPDIPGRYIGVVGKHRWYACHKVNKSDLIEAKVVSVSEASAALKRDAENLFRNPLTPAQAALAIKRWNDAYGEEWRQYRVDQEERAAKKEAAAKALGQKPKPQVQSGPNPIDPAAEPHDVPEADPAIEAKPEAPAPPANFAKDVAEKTGKSETSVKRSLKIANAFTEEQLETFDQMGVHQTWMETIAAIEDPTKRAEVVALIASGKEVAEAIGIVTGTAEVKRSDGVVKDAKKSENSLSDEEWLETHCSEILAVLPHKASFKANAILYRLTSEYRATFKSKIKSPMDLAKREGATAGLYGLLSRVANLSHPKHWLRCSKCQGHGVVSGESEACKKCLGSGFTTTTEAK